MPYSTLAFLLKSAASRTTKTPSPKKQYKSLKRNSYAKNQVEALLPRRLAVATARLNARLCNQGLSSRELWTQRNQFSNEQIPLSDFQHIMEKHRDRQTNHPFSEQAKGGRSPSPSTTILQVGNLVYVKADRDKSRALDRYIIVSIDGEWCFIKKFSGSQLRLHPTKSN